MPTPIYETSALLTSGKITHSFFGRDGGVSKEIYKSLNCGEGSHDAPEAVTKNRSICAAALGGTHINTAHQTHSAQAVYIHENLRAPRPKADALVTDQSNIIIGALAADCMTVLFHDPTTHIIGAAHAGWKGALGGVLESCVTLMIEKGAEAKHIKAGFGPCLRPPHFEVGRDLYQLFTGKHPHSDHFFAPQGNEKYQLNLTAFAQWRLIQMGLSENHIDQGAGCTLATPDKYFSYRDARKKNQEDYGRNLAAIMLIG